MDTVTIFFGGKLSPVRYEMIEVNKKENRSISFMVDSFEEGGKVALSDMNFMKNLLNFEKD